MNRTARLAFRVLPCFLACCSIGGAALAQENDQSSGANSFLPSRSRADGSKSQSSPAAPTGAFFKFGPIALHPHLSTSYAYSQGLPTETGKRVSSEVFTGVAGLLVDLGERWSLDYTPTWTSYSAGSLEDNLSQSISLNGGLSISEWLLQFSESYAFSNSILEETARQTERRTWVGSLGAGRSFGTGFNLATSLGLNESYSESSPDSRDWSIMNWLMFKPFHRLVGGVGTGVGYSDIVGQPNSISYRMMGRLNWVVSDKLNFGVDGGVESRHARITGASDVHNPLVNANLTYNPFKVTTVTLNNTRTVTNSLFRDQIKQSSLWSIGLNQRLLGHFFAQCAYTFGRTSFSPLLNDIATAPFPEETTETDASGLPVSPPGRSDRSNAISVALTTQLFQRIGLSASFQNSKNKSSQPGFELSTKRFNIELSLSY